MSELSLPVVDLAVALSSGLWRASWQGGIAIGLAWAICRSP